MGQAVVHHHWLNLLAVDCRFEADLEADLVLDFEVVMVHHHHHLEAEDLHHHSPIPLLQCWRS